MDNHKETSWGFIKEMNRNWKSGKHWRPLLSWGYIWVIKSLFYPIVYSVPDYDCPGDWVPHRVLLRVQAGPPGDLGRAALECGAAGLAGAPRPDHAHQGERHHDMRRSGSDEYMGLYNVVKQK